MSDALSSSLADAGPHTVESLSRRLPHFAPETIRQALEELAAQGVLERRELPDGTVEYRYTAPERYLHAGRDVVRDPGTGIRRRPR